MERNELSSGLRPSAVKLLTARITLDVLEIATSTPVAANDIANALDKDVRQLWHHIRAMVHTGLLEEKGLRKRSGRPQKLYESSAKEFFIPAELRRTTVGRELSCRLEGSLENSDSALGERFYFDGSRWRVEKLYGPLTGSEAQQHDLWLICNLTAQQRQELYEDVEKLFEKYRDVSPPSRKRSIVRFACAPFADDGV